jgi:hypothetical protein
VKQSTKKMINEIRNCVEPKLYNIENGTAGKVDIQIAQEASAYISLLKHSSLPEDEIKRLWDKSGLAYR